MTLPLLVWLVSLLPCTHPLAAPANPLSATNRTPKLISRLLQRNQSPSSPSSPSTIPLSDNSVDEIAAMERAYQSDPSIQEMFRRKLEDWRTLKEEGVLEVLRDEAYDDEAIDRIDEVSRRLLRRRRAKATAEGDVKKSDNEGEDKNKELRALLGKASALMSTKSSALSFYALLNEAKDKSVCDGPLMETILLGLARSSSGAGSREEGLCISAFKQYCSMAVDGKVTVRSDGFTAAWADTCINSGLHGCARDSLLLASSLNLADPASLTAANYCLELATCLPEEMDSVFARVEAEVPSLSVRGCNLIIKALGKAGLANRVLQIMDAMKKARLAPDDESHEFLSNAFVRSVSEEGSAATMTDLPTPDPNSPEIIFVGRSNVGKSSLVNYTLNRKTLASTSATPGHTRRFHFFSVNKERADVPRFHLVDVPGMGYAEADESTTDSWRSLLERYLTVRDSLSTVLHLIDARHGLTPTDEQLLDMLSRARAARTAAGRRDIKYVVVLTKTDKASAAQVAVTLKRAGGQVEKVERVVKTSAVAKVGREELWRTIVDHLEEFGRR